MTRLDQVIALLMTQQGHLYPWAPVLFGAGIAFYFNMSVEPASGLVMALGVLALVLAGGAMWRGMPVLGRLVIWPVALMAAGFAVASLRAHHVAGPVIERGMYGAVTGRIVGIDRSASGAPRLTLDQVRIPRLTPDETPTRVRISVSGDGPHTTFLPGLTVGTTAYISPNRGAVEPGGFDFRRHAWFQRLGAVGYTRVPVIAVAAAPITSWSLRITQWRLALSREIQRALPGPNGGVAAAILVGDRSALDADVVSDLRATNLAHLLAISGLHMGLAAGTVFGFVRLALALIPYVALRWPIKQIAAVAGFVAAACYFAMSGGNVATERAFVMVAVALGAVLLNRRALSLRAVATAALIVLTLRPEALLSPGFQMSFAATTALVGVFSLLRDVEHTKTPGWARPMVSLFVASSVAGLATAPVAAAHFNMFAHYGLIANLVSVPMMSLVIMPFCVAALALMPLGLAGPLFYIAGLGIAWIVGVADTVAGWDGAVRGIATPPDWVLPSIALAGLWFALIKGRARWAGAPIAACVLLGWGTADRPDILIDGEGKLVGVTSPQGRALSREKGSGFVAKIWLENDGFRTPQAQAADGWHNASQVWNVAHVSGKRAARTPPDCIANRVIVSNVPLDMVGECLVLGPETLRQTGSIAVWQTEQEIRVITANAQSGDRLWSPLKSGIVLDWPETSSQ